MADTRQAQNQTGGRDDILIDASRCLPMRFCESSCRRCADACPQGVIGLEGSLSVNPSRCTGCLLCTAACPSGALEQSNDFHTCVTQLSRVPDPVLGCHRTRDTAHATLACLGGLAEEHLLALSHTLSGKLTLNLTRCGDCPNVSIVPYLMQRLHGIAKAGLFNCCCRIVLAESPGEIEFKEESVGRRSFFKSFSNSIFKSAAVVLSSTAEPVVRRVEYSSKRLPIRRELLAEIRKTLSPAIEVRIRRRFDSSVSFGSSCTTCQGCVAICPTGALQTDGPDKTPSFSVGLCTGCGLCGEFCLDGALRVTLSSPLAFSPVPTFVVD